MRRGGVGLCVATQIARYVAPGNPLPGWHSPEQAWAMTQGQLAWYRAMEERGELVQIRDRDGARRHLARWQRPATADRADRLHAEPRRGRLDRDARATWSARTRTACAPSGPAHYGPGVYAQGTNASGVSARAAASCCARWSGWA